MELLCLTNQVKRRARGAVKGEKEIKLLRDDSSSFHSSSELMLLRKQEKGTCTHKDLLESLIFSRD